MIFKKMTDKTSSIPIAREFESRLNRILEEEFGQIFPSDRKALMECAYKAILEMLPDAQRVALHEENTQLKAALERATSRLERAGARV